jgi:hypothetical protein
MDDRRRWPRIPFQCPIVLFGKDKESYEGTVVDISERGLLADFNAAAKPKEIESFRIEYSEGHPAFAIEGDAQIVRVSPEGFLGIYLLKTDAESLSHLRTLIELNLADPEAAESEIDKG